MNWRIGLGGLLVFLGSGGQVYADDIRACIVAAVDGEASIIRRNGETQTVSPTTPIEHSDRIVTGQRARVFITCDDDTSVTIGAATDIDLGALLGPQENEGYAARLFNGIAGFIFPSPSAERFEVRTPSAVASVRSTAWTVDVTTGGTSVFVREGLVSVISQNAGGELGPGQGIDIEPDVGPVPVKTWEKKRVVAMNARLSFDWR